MNFTVDIEVETAPGLELIDIRTFYLNQDKSWNNNDTVESNMSRVLTPDCGSFTNYSY